MAAYFGVRVVHISDSFLPRLGGIEIQISELARIQQEAGHDVVVVTSTPDKNREVHAPVPVHRLPTPLGDIGIRPWSSREVGPILDRVKPDVVHVHLSTVSAFAWSAARHALERRVPVVATVHSMWDPFTRSLNRLFDWTGRWPSLPIVMTAVSEAAADPIRRVTGDRLPVRVVANGIDPADWRIPRRPSSEAKSEQTCHVVSVGRLAVRKKPVSFMKMLYAAKQRLPGVNLRATLAGDGSARLLVERYLKTHGMASWVSLAGRLDRSQVHALLSKADLFVAPAWQESFGIAALEARTAGVPLVAYSMAGIADFVEDGVEGLLGHTESDLTDAIVRLATDTELRERISEHNRVTEPKHCTWTAVVDGFEHCYAEAAARLS